MSKPTRKELLAAITEICSLADDLRKTDTWIAIRMGDVANKVLHGRHGPRFHLLNASLLSVAKARRGDG